MANQEHADGITIQMTAYALLTAVKVENREWADKIAHWLISQENYNGGLKSTHVSIMVAKTNLELSFSSEILSAVSCHHRIPP